MADLTLRLAEAERALATLNQVLRARPKTTIDRDAAFLRLILCIETVWKATQEALRAVEGMDRASPKGSIRAARAVGVLTDSQAEAALDMVNDRNLTIHLYKEALAEEMAGRMPNNAALPATWLDALKEHSRRGAN